MNTNNWWAIAREGDFEGKPMDPPFVIPGTLSRDRTYAWSKAIKDWPGHVEGAPTRGAAIARIKRREHLIAVRVHIEIL